MTRRLLLVSPAFHGYWQSIEAALSRRGYAVTTLAYDQQPGLVARARTKIVEELPERLGRPARAKRADHTARAVDALEAVDPQVVLVVKGDTLGPAFWERLAGRKVPRALWLYDELRRTRHTPETLDAAGPIASYSRGDVATLVAEGRRAVHVPLAHDPHVPFESSPAQEVIFVGARYPAREHLLTHLAEAGLPVRAYGRDWSTHPIDRLRTWRLDTPPVPAGRDLSRARAYAAMAGAAASLNIHGDQDGFTMRTFESAGIGAVQLVDRPEVSEFYDPTSEVAVFDSPEEAVELSRRALEDARWAEGLRSAARRRTLAEHTFDHRIAALEDLWQA